MPHYDSSLLPHSNISISLPPIDIGWLINVIRFGQRQYPNNPEKQRQHQPGIALHKRPVSDSIGVWRRKDFPSGQGQI
jgi:hypothetical protein